MDYQEKEKTEYLALLSDAGWTMAHKASGDSNPFIIGFMVVWGTAIAVLAVVSLIMALGIAKMKRRARGKSR